HYEIYILFFLLSFYLTLKFNPKSITIYFFSLLLLAVALFNLESLTSIEPFRLYLLKKKNPKLTYKGLVTQYSPYLILLLIFFVYRLYLVEPSGVWDASYNRLHLGYSTGELMLDSLKYVFFDSWITAIRIIHESAAISFVRIVLITVWVIAFLSF